jgi:hypothetical protein
MIFSLFMHWATVWRQVLGASADIRSPTSHELDRVARELWLEATPPIVKIASLDVGGVLARPDVARRLRQLCDSCNKYSRCENEFFSDGQKNNLDNFCPNARRFNTLLSAHY